MSGKKKSAAAGESPPEVPIFLQKTYHMIDTCPPTIATWSSDGLTFIVRNTHLFETTIIPQFFKHSKFSSFVRQLNFYGFRKIRFQDSLKIDLEKEREQRNFWRFKHESFRRGRKDLLREIKRSASSSNNSGGGNAAAAAKNEHGPSTTSPNKSPTNSAQPPQQQQQEVSRLNNEVNVLKEQMQSMATKMDDLTCLVKNMNVQSTSGSDDIDASVGNKRKKTCAAATADVMRSDDSIKMEQDDVDMMSMDLLEDAATTLLPDLALSSSSSAPSSLIPTPVLSRCSSVNGGIMERGGVGESGEDFVDELFHAFATDNDEPSPSILPTPVVEENPNKPDPQLMKRIEDSLSTIPKTMHEMVANRLIDAIAEGNSSCSSSGGVCSSSSSSASSEPAATAAPATDKENTLNHRSSIIPDSATSPTTEVDKTTIPLPLAVATLKTILADYGLKVECGSISEDAMVHRRLSNKSLPLVPMHA